MIKIRLKFNKRSYNVILLLGVFILGIFTFSGCIVQVEEPHMTMTLTKTVEGPGTTVTNITTMTTTIYSAPITTVTQYWGLAKFPGPDFPAPGIKIIHGLDAAYPPFTEVDPTGKAVGFDVDVVDWIAAKYGWEVEHKAWDWATIVTALMEGVIDFVASGMTHTAARAEKVWFTIPYYTFIHQFIVPLNDIRTRDEILNSGEIISCQLGSTSEEWAVKLLAEGYNFEKLALDSYELAFEAVLNGRVAGCISDSGFTGPYFKRNPEAAGDLKILDSIGGYEVYAYATRPGDFGLRNALNHALAELMASPEWDAMKEKWGI